MNILICKVKDFVIATGEKSFTL